MTYNRDLQEDKERLFDTADTVRACVRLMAAMLDHTTVKTDVCRAAASDPQLLATDLADYLVKKGMPFRQAHHVVGAVVGFAEQAGKPLDQVTVAEFQKISPQFGADVADTFQLDRAMQRRAVIGAPGTKEVKKQLARWQSKLAKLSS